MDDSIESPSNESNRILKSHGLLENALREVEEGLINLKKTKEEIGKGMKQLDSKLSTTKTTELELKHVLSGLEVQENELKIQKEKLKFKLNKLQEKIRKITKIEDEMSEL